MEEHHIRRLREAASICPGVVPFQLASGRTGLSRIGENLPGSISERRVHPERIRADRPSAGTGFCGAEKKTAFPLSQETARGAISCR